MQYLLYGHAEKKKTNTQQKCNKYNVNSKMIFHRTPINTINLLLFEREKKLY